MATKKQIREELSEAKANLEKATNCILALNEENNRLRSDKIKAEITIEVLKDEAIDMTAKAIEELRKNYYFKRKPEFSIWSILFIILFFISLLYIPFGIKIYEGTNRKNTVREFVSDGCSMFPDGNYSSCCVEHDKAYYKGGTSEARSKADLELAQCVAKIRDNNYILANIMYLGVRAGGTPLLPTSWRWGFGREYWQSFWYDQEEK